MFDSLGFDGAYMDLTKGIASFVATYYTDDWLHPI
jgi:hypothetical protein